MYSVDAYDTPAAERTLNFVNTHLTHYIDLYTNCPTASYDMTHPYSSHQKSLFADLSPPLVEHDSYLLPQFAVDCIFEPSPEVSTGCLAFDAEPDASYFNHASNQLLSPAQSSSPPFAIEHTGRHDSLQHAPPEQQVHKKSSVSPSRRSNKRAKLSKPPASTLRSQRHKIKFTAEDDALLVDLKETYNYTWKQIEAYFPGRTHGTLQVRYCTRLKTQSSMWDDESVRKLWRAIQEYESNRWKAIALQVGLGKSAAACKAKAFELGVPIATTAAKSGTPGLQLPTPDGN